MNFVYVFTLCIVPKVAYNFEILPSSYEFLIYLSTDPHFPHTSNTQKEFLSWQSKSVTYLHIVFKMVSLI